MSTRWERQKEREALKLAKRGSRTLARRVDAEASGQLSGRLNAPRQGAPGVTIIGGAMVSAGGPAVKIAGSGRRLRSYGTVYASPVEAVRIEGGPHPEVDIRDARMVKTKMRKPA